MGRTFVLRCACGVARFGGLQACREFLEFRRQRLNLPLLPKHHVTQVRVGALQKCDLRLDFIEWCCHAGLGCRRLSPALNLAHPVQRSFAMATSKTPGSR